ncbi:MAG: hypothetical protein H6617_06355 [Bdellovibrionaceae bacterium]|nr:hypothetical protein [Bdellovibrionales bacterium]MCB9254287.1 hypothetical protein [Pseudobdellovibrionaceae bacterium]
MAYRLFLAVFFVLTITAVAKEGPLDDHGSVREAARQAEAQVSAAMQKVLDRIQRMEDIVNGKIEAPKSEEQSPFLMARSTLVEKYVKELLEALDNGKLEKKLENVLIEAEAYTDAEHKAVFEENGKDTFEDLKDEKEDGAVAYTESRKKLRLAMLVDLAKALEAQGDPRALLLADAVRATIKESQRSYDLAIQNIRDNDLDRPICFTCGEPVAKDGTPLHEGEDSDYDFYAAMGDAATAAIKTAKIRVRDGHVAVPHFDPSRKTFSYDGNQFFERGKEGSRTIGKSKTGSLTLATGSTPARILDTSRPDEKELLDLWMDFRNSPDKHKIGTTLPSAKKAASSYAAKAGSVPQDKVNRFVQANREDKASLSERYPTADSMAKALGLVDEKGESLLVHKNDHWAKEEDGAPKADYNEYGVKVRWDAIQKLPEAQKASVLQTLKAVQRGSISDFKVVRQDKDGKQVGYCLWCNLNNDSAAVEALAGQ